MIVLSFVSFSACWKTKDEPQQTVQSNIAKWTFESRGTFGVGKGEFDTESGSALTRVPVFVYDIDVKLEALCYADVLIPKYFYTRQSPALFADQDVFFRIIKGEEIVKLDDSNIRVIDSSFVIDGTTYEANIDDDWKQESCFAVDGIEQEVFLNALFKRKDITCIITVKRGNKRAAFVFSLIGEGFSEAAK